MQSYLKSRPVWIQLLLFMGMAVGIFMVVSLIGMAILSPLTGISMFELSDTSKWDIKSPGMLTYVRGMLLIQFLGLFVIPSLLFAYFSDPAPLDYIGLNRNPKAIYWIAGIAVLLFAIPLVEYTGLINRKINFGGAQQWMKSMEDEAAQQIKFMLGRRNIGELISNVIFIAVFAGVGEELFFRGVLQRLFIKACKHAWLGIIVTAILFSALHIQFFGFIPRLLLGILLGALYWYSGSLWPSIIAHFVYDAFFIVLSYFQPQFLENTEATLFNEPARTILALVSAVIVGLLIWVMKKNSTTTYDKVYRNDSIAEHQDLSF
ncbi:MAG TPA: type II CAAX endopeptidase family protein [Chitinophagaceae bacterium]|jgi:membrane protease YdiL (CAAX protease family)|nr:type II CAAX endopeptidase family protein [Chitinophagaceae bacterium]